MSGQSMLKPAYDEYAANYFTENGWQSCIVNKKGWYCDVIAVKNNVVAVIEVKSPAEGFAVKDYDDTKGLSDSSRQRLPSDFFATRPTRRQSVMEGITSGEGRSLIKLYAATIACQLCRYFYEYEEKVDSYQSAIGNENCLPVGSDYLCEPYLVVPVETQQQADAAANYLQSRGIISQIVPDKNSRLYVIKVVY